MGHFGEVAPAGEPAEARGVGFWADVQLLSGQCPQQAPHTNRPLGAHLPLSGHRSHIPEGNELRCLETRCHWGRASTRPSRGHVSSLITSGGSRTRPAQGCLQPRALRGPGTKAVRRPRCPRGHWRPMPSTGPAALSSVIRGCGETALCEAGGRQFPVIDSTKYETACTLSSEWGIRGSLLVER